MLTAYPVARKQKSIDICAAFARGCGGKLGSSGVLQDGPAFFFGVDASNINVWRQAKKRGDYYYGDNSYFDPTRGTHFRVTRNALQHSGTGKSDGRRFASLGIPIMPWRERGEHIVLCPQSDSFMRDVVGTTVDWAAVVTQAIVNFTRRPVLFREWDRNKTKLAATLSGDLAGAHALVTYSSAAAVTAVLAGVPVVCTGPSAAAPMAGGIADIENLPKPQREEWAAVLADNQWTIDEMRAGVAWAALN